MMLSKLKDLPPQSLLFGGRSRDAAGRRAARSQSPAGETLAAKAPKRRMPGLCRYSFVLLDYKEGLRVSVRCSYGQLDLYASYERLKKLVILNCVLNVVVILFLIGFIVAVKSATTILLEEGQKAVDRLEKEARQIRAR
jgi:hypothetical protein